MEYTIKAISRMAGVSTRTLRYYDEIGLLMPARVNSSGYRIYGGDEIDRLQQILFYRALGMGLEQIGSLLTSPSFDALQALKEHKYKLLEKKEQLELLLNTVEKTIAEKEGRIKMKDDEKFQGFKESMVAENEKKYGTEIRTNYGDALINESNCKLLNMSQEQYQAFINMEQELKHVLKAAMREGDPAGAAAQKAAALHREWLMFTWPKYTKEAHACLAQMYAEDERFRKYYDEEQPGTAAFLRDAILIYIGQE